MADDEKKPGQTTSSGGPRFFDNVRFHKKKATRKKATRKKATRKKPARKTTKK